MGYVGATRNAHKIFSQKIGRHAFGVLGLGGRISINMDVKGLDLD